MNRLLLALALGLLTPALANAAQRAKAAPVRSAQVKPAAAQLKRLTTTQVKAVHVALGEKGWQVSHTFQGKTTWTASNSGKTNSTTYAQGTFSGAGKTTKAIIGFQD